MKRRMILPLILCFFFACGNEESGLSPGEIIVSGQVINLNESSSHAVLIHFMNPLDERSSKSKGIDPADGSFRIAYEMPYGQSFNIQYEGRFITLYAEPGDSIHVTIDAEKLRNKEYTQMTTYSGDKADINRQFTPAYTVFTNEINSDNSFYDDELSPEEFYDAVKIRLQTSRDSLAAYAKRENLLDKTVSLIDREIFCTIVYYAGGYTHENGEQEIMNKIFSPEFFDPFDPVYRTSQMFSPVLGSYVNRCIGTPFDHRGSRESLVTYLSGFSDEINRKPKGLSRDLMIENTFGFAERYFPGISSEFPELRDLFDSEYVWEQYLESLSGEVPGFENTPIPGISLINPEFESEPLPTVDFFEYLKQRYPGKAVYVDICAHWCSPCRSEFPHMSTLHESFKNENVAFVTLWMQSELERCVNLIREFDMKEECYFFDNDAYTLFRGTYGFAGFPTYMLIDKNGKLVNLKAGRPSEPGTIDQIKELL